MINEDGAIRLSRAIIGQAVKDYTTALAKHDKSQIIIIEKFLRSGFFDLLSDGMDGDSIIIRCRRLMAEFEKQCQQHEPAEWKNEDEAAKCAFRCPFCGGKVSAHYWTRRNQRKVLLRSCIDCGVKIFYDFETKELIC